MLDLLTTQSFAAFMLALLGGLHCVGMCGGFVGAMQIQRPTTVSPARLAAGYHCGRVASYTAAGALAGTIGGTLYAADVLPLQIALLIFGSMMLLMIGASLLGRASWLKRLEPAGVRLWQVIAPMARRVYPPRTGRQAVAAGLLWGWIPCGMVYAALPLALVSGGAAQGALIMLAFGLGTLPNMLALDVAIVRFGPHGVHASGNGVLAQVRGWARPLAGAAIVVFGVSGLAHAARVAGADHPAIAAVASLCHR